MSRKSDSHEEHIVRSWYANAEPWSRAIKEGSIVSRVQVTDQAVVDAVCDLAVARVLDVGCGEGWLTRALTGRGRSVVGIDMVPALVAEAQAQGSGQYHVCSYDDLAAHRWRAAPFAAAVCNFSLLGEDTVESMLDGVRFYLEPDGYLVVQTLHPVVACGNAPYRDGWRCGSWRGFSADFSDPAPWYFRTLSSWYAMLRRCGFEVLECREPTSAEAVAPSSVIFICRCRARVAFA